MASVVGRICRKVSLFKYDAGDERLLHRRRFVDPLLSTLFYACVMTYSIIEGMSIYDSTSYESVCYSSNEGMPDGEKLLKLKHLCYTDDPGRPQEWKQYALKTRSCSGEAASTWGIGLPTNKKDGNGDQPASNNGGQPGPAPNNGGQPAHAPNNGGQPAHAPGGPPGNNNGGQPANNNKGGRRLSSVCTKSHCLHRADSRDFCTHLVHYGEKELSDFTRQSMHDSCMGDGCRPNVDTSIVYTDPDCDGGDAECNYYKITGQASGLTCCGFRVQGIGARIFAWLGAIGGFAGLVHSIVSAMPPWKSDADKDDDTEVMHSSSLPMGKRATE